MLCFASARARRLLPRPATQRPSAASLASLQSDPVLATSLVRLGVVAGVCLATSCVCLAQVERADLVARPRSGAAKGSRSDAAPARTGLRLLAPFHAARTQPSSRAMPIRRLCRARPFQGRTRAPCHCATPTGARRTRAPAAGQFAVRTHHSRDRVRPAGSCVAVWTHRRAGTSSATRFCFQPCNALATPASQSRRGDRVLGRVIAAARRVTEMRARQPTAGARRYAGRPEPAACTRVPYQQTRNITRPRLSISPQPMHRSKSCTFSIPRAPQFRTTRYSSPL